jgi:hypothetical protein
MKFCSIINNIEPDYKWKQKLVFQKEVEYEINKINSGFLSEKTIENIIKRLVNRILSKKLLCKDSLN